MTNVKIKVLERTNVTMVWHIERMNAKIVLVNVKHFVVESLKRGIPKRWKKAINKSMLTRGLKESDAQDCAVWRISCKNWHTSPWGKTSQVLQRWSLLSTLQKQTDDMNNAPYINKVQMQVQVHNYVRHFWLSTSTVITSSLICTKGNYSLHGLSVDEII